MVCVSVVILRVRWFNLAIFGYIILFIVSPIISIEHNIFTAYWMLKADYCDSSFMWYILYCTQYKKSIGMRVMFNGFLCVIVVNKIMNT